MAFLQSIYKAFTDTDASLVEINPFITTKDDKLFALDAKITFDDNALFRHPHIKALRDTAEEDPLEVEASKYALNYIKLDGSIACMSSGPLFLMVLEKENAIADLRKLMGATNPANADEGTIRKKFAGSIQENAIHGSDAEETAAFEIGYWFAGYELI